MAELKKNKLDDMEMDKVSGGVDVPPVYVTRTPPDFKKFEKQDKEKVYPEKETPYQWWS